VFEYRWFDSVGTCPYPPLVDYAPPPATFLALSLLKPRLAALLGTSVDELEARHKVRYWNERTKARVVLPILPDAGEDSLRDYQLARFGPAGREILCVADVEHSHLIKHVTKGLRRRLAPARCPLKVGIYRTGERLGRDGTFKPTLFERRCAERVAAIARVIEEELARAAALGEPHTREDWLFILYPYYSVRRPTCPQEALVRLYTVSTTAPRRVEIVPAGWDFWDPEGAEGTDRWLRSNLAERSPLPAGVPRRS